MKKILFSLLSFVTALLVSTGATGQVFTDDFGTTGGGASSTSVVLTGECFDGDNTDYFGVLLASEINQTFPNANGAFLAGQDMDGAPCSAGNGAADWTGINVGGETGLVLCVDIAEGDSGDGNEDWDGDANVTITVTVDGVAETVGVIEAAGGTNTEPGFDCSGDGMADGTPISSTFNTFCFPIAATGSALDVNISISNLDAGDEDIAIDNVEVYSDSSPTTSPLNTACGGTSGCTDMLACNYDPMATIEDGSCYNIGDTCDDGDGATFNDVYVDCTTCQGMGSGLVDCGAPAWEAVQVVNNSMTDVWTVNAGVWSMNGFVGGAAEQVDQWLVYGPIDVSALSSFFLNFDATEGFGVTDLNIVWTDAYTGCPTDATWTNAAIVTDAGAISVDLSAATGTAVFIAIEYSDDGADGYSDWALSNFSLLADVCPTPGLPMISNCMMSCSISNVSVVGSCAGADYVYNVFFSASNGSGSYDVIDVASGSVLANGATSPIAVTIAGSTSTTSFDINVVDNADNTCTGMAATVTPVDCSAPSTCPGAFINELAYDCDMGDANEVIEVCIPNTFTGNLADLQIDLYNGSNSSVYTTITLDMFTAGTNDGTNTYYSWAGSGSSIQNGAPDGMGLSYQGNNCEFISYEGTITAADGPASGLLSTDIGASQTNSTTCDETIQLFGGTWVNACATVGDPNSDQPCTVTFDCPAEMANFGDPCDDMDANTTNDVIQMDCTCAGESNTFDCPTEMANFGDPCDDMDANTTNDVIQMDCTCAGTVPANCPGAFINELAYDCDMGDANEVIEVCVPNTFTGSLADLQIDLYNGSNSSVYTTITLDMFTAGTNDGTNTYYSWAGSGSSIQNGAPDGLALSYQGGTCEFISYEGTITAADGPASGLLSTDIGASQTNSTTCDETIQLFGGTWVNACATVGDANSDQPCTVTFDCPAEMANFGDSCDDMDANTTNDVIQMDCTCAGSTSFDCPTEMANFGDPCDDMDADTENDVIQMDCSCAGTPIVVITCPATAKINEFHYDNMSGDVNEFVEIALPMGSDPTSVVITLYNGGNGQEYSTYTLTAADFGSSDGTNDYYVWYPSTIQNGAPDGIAVSCGTTVFQFITYEGSFDATNGPAAGMTGVDVGVEEASDGLETSSIMCDGTGTYLANCTADPGMANNTATCVTDVGCTLAAGSCDACPAGNDNIAIDLTTGEAFNDGAELCAAFDCNNPIDPAPTYDNLTNTGTWTLPAGVVNAFAVGGVNNLTLPNVVNGGCLTADLNIISGTTPFVIEFRIENGTGAPGNGGQALVFDATVDGTGACSMGGDFSTGNAVNGFTFTPGTTYSVVIALADFSGGPVPSDIVVEVSNIALSVCAPNVPGCIDPAACNFDATATTDNGSCVYATGCDTCENGVVIDNPEVGETCDDGNPDTINDVVQENCLCIGEAPQECTIAAGACSDCPAGDANNSIDLAAGEAFNDGAELCAAFDCNNPIDPAPTYDNSTNTGIWTLPAGVVNAFAVGGVNNLSLPDVINGGCLTADINVLSGTTPFVIEFRIENGTGAPGNGGQALVFDATVDGTGVCSMGGDFGTGNAVNGFTFTPGTTYSVVVALADFSGGPVPSDIVVEVSNIALNVCTPDVVQPDCAPSIIQFPANPTGN